MRPTDKKNAEPRPEGERIAKLLARAGVASRREVERMIDDGRVAVNGKVLDTPATILPNLRGVAVDGKPVAAAEQTRVFAFHKPSGLLTAERDPKGRPTIYTALRNALPKGAPRVMPVGRLDLNTEGLLLLTNDGELAHRLTHPSFEISKTYVCRFDCPGTFPRGLLKALRDGVELEDGPARADQARLVAHDGREAVVEVVLHEGRNRIVRRMFSSQGFELTALVRTRIGPVLLGDLAPGTTRRVEGRELGTLMAEVGL